MPVGTLVVFTDVTTGGTSPYQYSWDFGNGITSILQNPTYTYGDLGTYNVSLVVEDAEGQTAEFSLLMTVVEDTFLEASFTASATTITLGESITFTDTTTGGNIPFTYSWNFGDGSISTLEDPIYTYSQAGTYSVTLTVTDADGVADTYTLRITVEASSISDDGDDDNPFGEPFGNIPGSPFWLLNLVVLLSIGGIVVRIKSKS